MVVSPTAVSRPERYRDLHLNMDFASASAALDSCPMVLTRKEYALLSLLVRNAGEIIPRDALLRIIWGYGPQIRTSVGFGRSSAFTAKHTLKRSLGSVTAFDPFAKSARCRTISASRR